MQNLVIATIKSWNIKLAKELKEALAGSWNVHIITEKQELNSEILQALAPRYIFFPHWSWLIPKSIHRNFECVVFHMTDLPFGRGGSPLQNLIVRKIYETRITALQVEEGLDTGPVYTQEPFQIYHGSAAEIYQSAAQIIFRKMIPWLLREQPTPEPQTGEITEFKRRTPDQSQMEENSLNSIQDLYDFIRMLDAEGYPEACLDWGAYRFSFNSACLKEGHLEGRFTVKKKELP